MRLARAVIDGVPTICRAVGDGYVSTPWTDFAEVLDCPDLTEAATHHDARPVTPDALLAPLRDRAQIIGVGANYSEHRAEGGIAATMSEPVFFAILWGAVVGPGEPVVVPGPEAKVDYEVELAVVVGRRMSQVSPPEALDHVFGYTIANDVSARAVTAHERMQIMLSKSADTFLPVGPVVVTADELPDPQDLRLRTHVNGELRQDSSTAFMTASVAELLSTLSRTVTLHPGDVLVTGTPAGVGQHMDPPTYLGDGDLVAVTIDGIGTLSNPVRPVEHTRQP